MGCWSVAPAPFLEDVGAHMVVRALFAPKVYQAFNQSHICNIQLFPASRLFQGTEQNNIGLLLSMSPQFTVSEH